MVAARYLVCEIQLRSVNGGCAHYLGIPGYRVRYRRVHRTFGADRIGILCMPESWLSPLIRQQLEWVPRRHAHCLRCHRDFILVEEQFLWRFNWYDAVQGRYAEALYSTFDPTIVQEFRDCADEAQVNPAAMSVNSLSSRVTTSDVPSRSGSCSAESGYCPSFD